MNFDLSLFQHMEFLFQIATQDIYIPPALLEFPNIVETLPHWVAFGPMGAAIAHELGHALVVSLQVFADKSASQENWNHTYYYTSYMVRCFLHFHIPNSYLT